MYRKYRRGTEIELERGKVWSLGELGRKSVRREETGGVVQRKGRTVFPAKRMGRDRKRRSREEHLWRAIDKTRERRRL